MEEDCTFGKEEDMRTKDEGQNVFILIPAASQTARAIIAKKYENGVTNKTCMMVSPALLHTTHLVWVQRLSLTREKSVHGHWLFLEISNKFVSFFFPVGVTL